MINTMSVKKYRPFIEIFSSALLFYIINKVLFYYNATNPKFSNYFYTLETLYGFFFFLSVLILFILIKVKKINIDYVGYSFLLLTSIKMVISYIFLYPILQMQPQTTSFEKINFFIVFALFLAIETTVTIRILNNKQ